MIEYTIQEYARLTGLAYRTILWQIKEGRVDSVKRGRRRFIIMNEPMNEVKTDLGRIILGLKDSIDEILKRLDSLEKRVTILEDCLKNNNERKVKYGKQRRI